MIAQAYLDYCEALWKRWLNGRLSLPPDVAKRFQLEHAPEPYLRFGNGRKPLYVLLTNPGSGLPHQRRDTILAGQSCINRRMSYYEASLRLGDYYQEELPPKAARRKIEAMVAFRQLMNADCIVQFESIPFHSPSLPGKRRVLKLTEKVAEFKDYTSALKVALNEISVIAVSAVGSRESISTATIAGSDWLRWQASLLGIDPNHVTICPLLKKGRTVTQAFLYRRVGQFTRGLILTMGGAPFPSDEGQEILAGIG
jgi:hypothetical protein